MASGLTGLKGEELGIIAERDFKVRRTHYIFRSALIFNLCFKLKVVYNAVLVVLFYCLCFRSFTFYMFV